MNIELLNKIDRLKEDIRKSKEYIEYKNAKENLENNEEAIRLTILKDKKSNEYSDYVRFNEIDEEKILFFQKEIKNILVKLNELEVVKIYKEKELEYNKIIDKINEEILKLWLKLEVEHIKIEI